MMTSTTQGEDSALADSLFCDTPRTVMLPSSSVLSTASNAGKHRLMMLQGSGYLDNFMTMPRWVAKSESNLSMHSWSKILLLIGTQSMGLVCRTTPRESSPQSIRLPGVGQGLGATSVWGQPMSKWHLQTKWRTSLWNSSRNAQTWLAAPCLLVTRVHKPLSQSTQHPCRNHSEAFQYTQSQWQRNGSYEPLAQQALNPWQGWCLCSSSGFSKWFQDFSLMTVFWDPVVNLPSWWRKS